MQNFRIPILAPFSNLVWVTLMSLLLIVTLLTSFLFRISHLPLRPVGFFKLRNLLKCVLCAVEHYCGRIPLRIINQHKINLRDDVSFNFVFKTGLVKLITTFCFTFILSIYTAKVISVLMKTDGPIKSPDDLLKYNYIFNSYSHIHVDRLFVVNNLMNFDHRCKYVITIIWKSD